VFPKEPECICLGDAGASLCLDAGQSPCELRVAKEKALGTME
jgi:hypothetical protein